MHMSIWPAQERRYTIRESWGKLSKEIYSSEVVVRFFVHCSNGVACHETEAHLSDIIYTRDGDDELGTLAEGQEGVTQRVCMPTSHLSHALEERTLCAWKDTENIE